MNAVDIVLVVLLVVCVLNGIRVGLVLQVAAIVGAVLGLFVARAEYGSVRAVLLTVLPKSPWLTIVAYVLVFLVVWTVVLTLARVARKGLRLLLLGWADRIGGAVIGLLEGVILVELFLYLALHVPNHTIHHAVKQAHLAAVFVSALPGIDRLFPYIHP